MSKEAEVACHYVGHSIGMMYTLEYEQVLMHA